MCAVHSPHSLSSNTKEAFRTSATFWRRIASVGPDVPLALQATKSRIHGADRHLTLSAQLNLLSHGNSIGPILEPQQRQDNDVLEFAEIIAAKHYLYNIE